MANPRDFEFPVAGFDVDQSDWEGRHRFPYYFSLSSN